MTTKTLVVGGGITGSLVSFLIKKAQKNNLKELGKWSVSVWEKNNILGGRMMSRSFRKNREVHVDMGAQYFTNYNPDNEDIRQLLRDEGKLREYESKYIHQERGNDGKSHEICSEELGFRSIVEFLLENTETQLSKQLKTFEVVDDETIRVIAEDGEEQFVNQLVLTCPIPQLLPILKNSPFQVKPEIMDALQKVEYSQRFAVSYLFDCDAISEHIHDLNWVSKYVTKEEDAIVRYLCWDHLKKQTNPFSDKSKKPPYATLLVHTCVPYGIAHLDDKNEDILKTINASVRKLLPFLPEEKDLLLHRWRISQVSKPFESTLSSSTTTLQLSSKPLILVAGDAFLGSKFDHCVTSAKEAAQSLVKDALTI